MLQIFLLPCVYSVSETSIIRSCNVTSPIRFSLTSLYGWHSSFQLFEAFNFVLLISQRYVLLIFSKMLFSVRAIALSITRWDTLNLLVDAFISITVFDPYAIIGSTHCPTTLFSNVCPFQFIVRGRTCPFGLCQTVPSAYFFVVVFFFVVVSSIQSTSIPVGSCQYHRLYYISSANLGWFGCCLRIFTPNTGHYNFLQSRCKKFRRKSVSCQKGSKNWNPIQIIGFLAKSRIFAKFT